MRGITSYRERSWLSTHGCVSILCSGISWPLRVRVGLFQFSTTDMLPAGRFFSQVITLLEFPECRTSTLRCLAMMTCHGGIDARYHVAGYTSDIVKLGQNDIDDPSVTEPCSIIISHCLTAILWPGENTSVDQKALKSVGSLIPVFEFVDALLRSSNITYKSFTHIMCFLMDISQNAREAFLSVRSSIAVMVACLRSSDLQLRIHALGGIMRLQYDIAFKGKVHWDPQAIMQNYTRNGRNTPDSVTDAMMDYGMLRTEIIVTMTCMKEYQDAMMKFAHNKDYYALGLTLFDLI